MRTDPTGSRLTTVLREPRVVIGIIFDVESIYLTNKPAISNVPGNVVHGCLKECASVSHELFPDEARSTIGSFSFSAVDLDAALTDELRSNLFNEFEGPRHNEVRVFTGDTDNFADGTWRRVATYQLTGVIANDTGLYIFSASDRQLDLRTEIFNLKSTRLTETITATETTLYVRSTEGFERLQHTEYFTDARLQLVGYVMVKKTKEIIRYTDIATDDPPRFLGCTRDVNSVASAVEVSGTDPDQWPEIIEFPYLEGTVVQIAYALMTGTILGTAITLPEHWHCGIDPANVDADSFSQVGADFHDDDDLSGGAGLIMRFIHVAKSDAKRFIEEELLRPAGCFLAITPEGKLKLKRFTAVLARSSVVAYIEPEHVVSHGPLQHDQDGVINQLTIDYNWDGDGFTRRSTFFNDESIATHGIGAARTMQFKGMPVTQHSAIGIRRTWLGLSSRYGAPPIYLDLVGMPYLNVLEVGDVVKVTLPSLDDYSDTGTFDRAMEVQQASMNWITGECNLMLFGSSVQTLPTVPVNDFTPLEDSWYESEGVSLTAAGATIVAGHLTTNIALGGGDDLRASNVIFYHMSNLTIDEGVTLSWGQNIQLRVLGTLTINGTLSSIGGGLAAITTPHVVNDPYVLQESFDVQTMGSTRGSAGLQNIPLSGADVVSRIAGPSRIGQSSLIDWHVKLEAGALTGLQADLRGTPGIYGQPLTESSGGSHVVKRLGGAGGAGGGGIVITCRGLEFGLNGEINVSGLDGAASTSMTLGDHVMYPGGGGGGAPGSIVIIMDNTEAIAPDLSGHVVADHGATIQTGNRVSVIQGAGPGDPITGDEPGIGVGDHWDTHSKVVYLVSEVALGEGDPELPPKPVFASYVATDYGVEVTLEVLPEIAYDRIQIYGSIDNDRANAVRVETGRGQWFRIPYDKIQTKWLWAYTVKGARRSEWSSDADDGFRATGGAPYQESDHWLETFDNYTSREDFEREWLISGNPTISFNANGINGGNSMRVTGAMRALYRRFVPYDASQLYECSTRFRAAEHEAGNELLSIGFFGATLDATIDGAGNPTGVGSIPNRSLCSAVDLANYPEWQRAFAWITGSEDYPNNPPDSQHLNLPMDRFNSPWHPSFIHALNSPFTRAQYIRPIIECNQPVGSNAACEIDYIEVRRVTSNIALDELADGNFSAADDAEFWTGFGSVAVADDPHSAQLVVGAGLNGGNALLFAVDGTLAGGQMLGISRNLLNITNTVTVNVQYILQDVVSIGSVVEFGLIIYPIVLNALTPRCYKIVPGGPVPEDRILVEDLIAGDVQSVTFTITDLFAHAQILEADYMQVGLAISAPEASDEFNLYVCRVRKSSS
jgi:hypothetical protein